MSRSIVVNEIIMWAITAAPKIGSISSPKFSINSWISDMAFINKNINKDVRKPIGGQITCHNFDASFLNAKYVESIVTLNEVNNQYKSR